MKDNLKRISVSVAKEPYEQMRTISDEQNISIGLAIRMAIEDFLTENDNEDYGKESFKDSSMHISKSSKERKRDWNKNIFSLRTSDEATATIKNYCKENKITFNSFFKKLIDDFFGKKLSESKNILEDNNLQRVSISVVKEHYEQIKKISDARYISSGLVIRTAIEKFLAAKSSENIKKEPLVNPVRAKSSENIKKEPLVNPVRANLGNHSNKAQNPNQREEDIFLKLEKLIDYKNKGLISEAEFKLLKSKLFEF